MHTIALAFFQAHSMYAHYRVERSSDRDGLHGSGMDSSSSGSNQGPSNSPTLKLKRKHPQE
uniref:Uncharacterized protein n=1 Tax=Vitis vinifera TaxID=29760 RepID=F6GYR3_VITVI